MTLSSLIESALDEIKAGDFVEIRLDQFEQELIANTLIDTKR